MVKPAPLDQLQGAFAETVLRGIRDGEDLPETLNQAVRGNGLDPKQRLQIHANNVRILLAESLAKTFPVCAALVGEAFFEAMAIRFAESNPPQSAALLDYGAGFPDFVAGFEHAKAVPYLSDVARLEWAWAESFHAADEAPATAETLGRADPEKLALAQWKPIASARLVRSAWPVDQIWVAHQPDAPITLDEINLKGDPAIVLIARPAMEVEVMRVGEIAAVLFEKLASGEQLGPAVESMGTSGSAALAALISAQILGTPDFGEGEDNGIDG